MAKKKKVKAEPIAVAKPAAEIKAAQAVLSKEQLLLNSMFGGQVGNRVLGDTRPRLNGIMRRGYGIIKNDDFERQTSNLFLPQDRGRGFL